LVKREKRQGCRIFYARRPEMETAEEKLEFLSSAAIGRLQLEEVRPDAKGNWVNLAQNDFDTLLPIATKIVKAVQRPSQEKAIFKLFSLGISTNRDGWMYDDDVSVLRKKVNYLVQGYNSQTPNQEFETHIKWSRNLKRRFEQGRHEEFDPERVVRALYRPYTSRWLYNSDLFIDEGSAKNEMFPLGAENRSICFSDAGSRAEYCVLAVSGLADLHFGASVDAYQQVPQFRFSGKDRIDNITD